MACARSGPLPEVFSAQGGCAQQLTELRLDGNALTGTLPAVWGNASMWPQLQLMNLTGNALSGARSRTLSSPLHALATCCSAEAWPSLQGALQCQGVGYRASYQG